MFSDSAITDLTPHSATESCSRFPDDVFPTLVGSGRFGMGVDASGLQATNSSIASTRGKDAPMGNGRMDDLYLVHGGLLSEHLFWDAVESADEDELSDDVRHVRDGTAEEIDAEGTLDHTYKNHREHFMPLGYLTYDLVVDGTTIRGEDLADHVRGEWSRETNLADGTVSTSFVVADALAVELTVFAPQDGHRAYVRAAFEPYEGVLGEMAAEHDVRFEPRIELSTRAGLPIYDEPGAVDCEENLAVADITAESRYAPHEDYTTVYGVGATDAATDVSADAVGATWETTVDDRVECDFVFAFHPVRDGDVDDMVATVGEQIARVEAGGVDDVLADHRADWQSFFDDVADVSFDRPGLDWRKEEYLLHASEYLMRCGHDFRQGASTCFYLHHQLLFHAAKWWDFHFMVDGVLHANMVEEAGQAVDWLDGVMAPEGRPFSYMLAYDGRPLIDEHREIVEMQVAAHAASAWKYYEANGDDDLLRETVYPILKRAADYAVDDLFEATDDGYRLVPLGHDSGGHTELTPNRTFHAAWFLTTLRKASEYADHLGVDADRRERWDDVRERFAFATDDAEDLYLYADDVHPADFDSEPPYFASRLLYPTEATADVDVERFRRTRDQSPPLQINKPWMSFAQAATDYRAGDVERGADQYALGRDLAFGVGFFKEIGPYGADGNMIPPFATAHGTHLTALLEQFASTDPTEGGVDLLGNLPPTLRGESFTFDDVRTQTGIVASGSVDGRSATFDLHNPGGERTEAVRIRPPVGVPRDDLVVTVDGQRRDSTRDDDLVCVSVTFDADEEKRVTVADASRV